MDFKTLHITNAWHPKSGGIRTFYLALLESANRAQHEMHLVVPASEDGLEPVGSHCAIHHVKAPFAPGSGCYRIIYPHEFLWAGGRLNRILRDVRPDLVEFCDKYTLNYLGGLLRLGLLPGVNFRPVVVGLSCEPFTESVRNYLNAGPLGDWLANQYLRWLYFPLADHHIAVSSFVAAELAAVSGGHKVDRGVWLGPMGVDYSFFAHRDPQPVLRGQLITRTCAGRGAVLLLYAGRLAREKNLLMLLDTVAGLATADAGTEYRLVIAGDGPQRATLERAAHRMVPGKVCFLGFQSKAELACLFQACDVFLHANPREPFGIAPLEAMAAGLPLVAPNTGGVTSYATEGNAWLADPSPSGFARAIREVVGDTAVRKVKIRNARATARACDWSRVAEDFLRRYSDIHRVAAQGPGKMEFEPHFMSTREASTEARSSS